MSETRAAARRSAGRAVEGSRTYSNQTSETETETETESEMFEEASAKRPAGADGKSGSGGDTGTGVNEKGPPPWKQLGIKIANAPKIDETENFANLQTTSKWFPNAYKAPEQPEETEQEMAVRKRQEFWTRTRWTFAMFLSFMFVIASGALYVAALIVCIKVGMFYEILGLKRNKEKDKRIPWFRTLNWYFFATTIYYVYGRILQYHIQVVHFERAYIGWLTDHHTFKSFALWCSGFVMFVLSLEKSTFKYQFTQFGWTHITLLMVVVSASCMIKNMFEGMVWFFIPVCLVIWNDVYAYVFGRFWGKTPLIKLSPKKTWEGFLGSFVTTIIFGFWVALLIPYFEEMICPQDELTLTPFYKFECEPHPIFKPTIPLNIPWWVQALSLPGVPDKVLIMPFMLHTLSLSLFASLIAPFGGFFASGFKRAFRIKDFGDLIPGHGGITDRMDCQIIMSVFVAVYRATFFAVRKEVSVAKILSQVDLLSDQDKQELLSRLQAAIGHTVHAALHNISSISEL